METIESLEVEYRKFAAAHGEATQRGDSKAANKNHDRLIALIPKFHAHGNVGEAALIRLINDEDDAVGMWAATHSLRFAEKIALGALERLATRAGPTGFSARMVVDLWKKGKLTIP